MADGEEKLCICPSFNGYSADRIAEIANKVTGLNTTNTENDENDDDEFEFALVGENQRILAQKFIYDSQIKQVFPVFNRNLLVSYDDFDKGSKRWKFRDLVRRCNNEGKDSFAPLTPKHKEEKSKEIANSKNSTEKRVVSGEKSAANSLHEAFYVRNRTIKEGDRKKSYLPYRQDLVGFFPNANGLGRRSFPAF
ncbi:Hypothetical predicted protein [Olea europaea subsp. europaea]|uniref:Uncharacterized protein n=1 Tax=Olea europaea subsp. europaea TaxID=158383 RepID=A0A8S0UGK9_OLEEU|nr:Hypothetical predicted protein [Olea europaea subsp. europaea]